MADENTQAPEGQTQETPGGSAPDTLVGDISKVDPKVLQAEIDRHVRKALKSREDNIAKQTQAEKAEQERKSAEERGEYEKLRQSLIAEREQLKHALVLKDVTVSLRDVARDAGLLDLDDLALLQGDAVADAVADDGTVDTKKLVELVERFKKAKPHKFQSAQPGQRFGGAPTPPPPPGAAQKQPISDPDHFRNQGLDEYVQKRQETLKRLKTPTRGGAADALAEALAKRLKL